MLPAVLLWGQWTHHKTRLCSCCCQLIDVFSEADHLIFLRPSFPTGKIRRNQLDNKCEIGVWTLQAHQRYGIFIAISINYVLLIFCWSGPPDVFYRSISSNLAYSFPKWLSSASTSPSLLPATTKYCLSDCPLPSQNPQGSKSSYWWNASEYFSSWFTLFSQQCCDCFHFVDVRIKTEQVRLRETRRLS